jgi:predicted secreted Zn-dependent protease
MSIPYYLIIIFGILLPPTNCIAATEIKNTIEYYSIYGNTFEELFNSMENRSPVSQGGKKFYAHTNWYVKYNYYYNSSNQKCWMSNVNSSVDIKYTMPQWKRGESVDANTKGHWHEYFHNLKEHELGHGKNGINAAEEVERTLESMSAINCSTLEKNANNTAQSIIKKYSLIDIQYDQRTNHGRVILDKIRH